MNPLKLCLPILLLCAACFLTDAGAGERSPSPSAKDKCPVCGMLVAGYPEWTGVILFRDAGRLYFDGPKDLFTWYLNPGKYDPSRKRSDVSAILVKDYYSLAFIDGIRAFYVMGSNVRGPMGKELVPFARKSDAEEFLRDHRGTKILRFPEVTPARLKELE